MNDENATKDRELLLKAIHLWLQGQRQKQQAKSIGGDV